MAGTECQPLILHCDDRMGSKQSVRQPANLFTLLPMHFALVQMMSLTLSSEFVSTASGNLYRLKNIHRKNDSDRICFRVLYNLRPCVCSTVCFELLLDIITRKLRSNAIKCQTQHDTWKQTTDQIGRTGTYCSKRTPSNLILVTF